MNINNVLVLGAGTMGNGIAHVFAQNGCKVIMSDISESALEKGISTIKKNLERQFKKGTITEEILNNTIANITLTTDYSQFNDVDLVVEAVTENKDLKFKIFRDLDEKINSNAILASNTSTISITEIAANTKRPEKVIGMHFMNPVPIMKLVEIIRGIATSEETFAITKELSEKFGKTVVESKDFPGFIANRVFMPMINEAIYTYYEGVGSIEGIDTVAKLGFNQPMGPFELADLIGLDVVLAILETLYEGFGDPKYRPCPLLRQYVDAGYLGRKTGRGFYVYNK